MTADQALRGVRLLVLGDENRGDDGVGPAAVRQLLADLAPPPGYRIDVRWSADLRIDDLLDLSDEMPCFVVDAVAGPPVGTLVSQPLDCLHEPDAGFVPRSSHDLPIQMILGLARMLRGRPVAGTFIGLAGARFDHRARLSAAVRAALPRFVAAIRAELGHLASRDPRGAQSVRDARHADQDRMADARQRSRTDALDDARDE